MNLRQFLRCEMVQKLVCLSMTVMVLSCLLLAPLSAWAVAAPGDWRWYGLGLNGESVLALAIDPANASILYAGTEKSGVYKSGDGGITWSSANGSGNGGLTNLSVKTLTIDSANSTTLYVGTWGGGVFKSIDSGGHWSSVTANYLVTAFELASSSTLYAGTLNSGVYKSINSSVAWNAANGAMTFPYIWSLALDPLTPATLYAGTVNSGVQKSINSGGSWSAINSGLPTPLPEIRSLAIDPVSPGLLYAGTPLAGIYKSDKNVNGGAWSPVNNGLTTLKVSRLAIDPISPAIIYAGTLGGGVFKSSGSGAIWESLNVTLTNPNVTALAIARTAPSTTVYAGTGDGVFMMFQQPVDTTPPTGSMMIKGSAPYTPTLSVTLSLSATDAVGVTGYYISTTATAPTVGSAGWVTVKESRSYQADVPYTLDSGEGARTIYVWYEDAAGNVSTNSSAGVVVDTSAPVDGTLTATAGNSKIYLSWSGFSDAVSGIAGYTVVYATGGEPSSCSAGTQIYTGPATSYTQGNLTNGTPYYYRICAVNNAGNISLGAVASAIPDGTAPSGGIIINGGVSATSTTLVTLTLSATDNGGITGYYLAATPVPPTAVAAGWTTFAATSSYSADVPFTLGSGDGVKSVYVWYKDAADNISPVVSSQIILDTVPPVDGIVTAIPGDAQVSLAWNSFTDVGSGIAGYTVVFDTVGVPLSCNAGTSVFTGGATSFTQTGLANGVPCYYRVCATDNAGNTSTGIGASATPDGNAPTGGISINGGASFTSSATVILSLTANDDVGVTGYYLSSAETLPTAGAPGWTTFASMPGYSATVPFLVSGNDGLKTVYVWYKDVVGNVSVAASYQITLDTTPPSDGLLTATPGDTQIMLSWNGYSDAGSGIAGYTVVYNTGSLPLSCSAGTQLYTGTETAFTHTGLSKTTPYYYRVCATDNVGNVSAGATAVAIPDITAPTGDISINGGATYVAGTAVTLALSAIDDGGVTGYYLATVATPPTAGATGWSAVASTTIFSANVPFTLSIGDGAKTLYVWYKDLAGNVSIAATSQITLDTTPPSNGVPSAVPGDTQVSLSWSGYSDAGSGIAGYTMVYGTGGVPASCQVGTQLYSGIDTSFTHTGLTNGTSYYYRICATDNVGNLSLGAGVSAMPQFTNPATLTVMLSGNGGGSVNSVTPGVSFTCSSKSCATTYAAGTSLTLQATPDGRSFFNSGWTGVCTGTGECPLTLDGDLSVTATFDAAPNVKVGVKEFVTLQAAYDDLATTNNSTIMLLQGVLPGAFTAGRNIAVYLDGGYRADYGAVSSETTLQGPVVVKSGTVVVNAVAVQ